MHLKLCEPLRLLFKDEVRRVGRELGMPEHLITRHPFPGPGLAVRILGDITPEKVRILQDADDIFIQGLRDWGLYDQVWQAGVILLPVQSVGVMGDERTYERAVALRAVTSTDAMTADWAHLPYDFLGKVSNDIINKVKEMCIRDSNYNIPQSILRRKYVKTECSCKHLLQPAVFVPLPMLSVRIL